ncbi:MAG: type II secretion system GspH family protein [Planctomycetes bacterium]|nr:type II secretion system GspH family protein [Planctomycetota bacterium]
MAPVDCSRDNYSRNRRRSTTARQRESGGVPRPSSAARRGRGFTLIELLVVIAIIALLAAMIVGTVMKVQKEAQKAGAKQELSYFHTALERYLSDNNNYPGYADPAEEDGNSLPAVITELYTKRHLLEDLKIDRIIVENNDDQEPYRKASPDEREDQSVAKYYEDPWGLPYVYRENKSKMKKEPWMINPQKYDLWSYGANNRDESASGEFKETTDKPRGYDDVGNWE